MNKLQEENEKLRKALIDLINAVSEVNSATREQDSLCMASRAARNALLDISAKSEEPVGLCTGCGADTAAFCGLCWDD